MPPPSSTQERLRLRAPAGSTPIPRVATARSHRLPRSSCTSGGGRSLASAEVLRQFFGTDHIAFSRDFTAPSVPLPAPMLALPAKPMTRSFHSLSQAVAEARDARVFGGLHFREGCKAGARQGAQIARFVVRHELRPLKKKHGWK